jgi:hypothetical protein
VCTDGRYFLEIQICPKMGGCFWQKRPATSLHDCVDIDGVASILTGIGLEALAKTIRIAAKQDRDLNSAVVCDRLNSLTVESFTANKAAFCSPLDRAALAQELAAKAGFLQAHSSWRSVDDTQKALCPSDDQNQASRHVGSLPLHWIPPRSKHEDGTRRHADSGSNNAEQLGGAAATLSVTDAASLSLSLSLSFSLSLCVCVCVCVCVCMYVHIHACTHTHIHTHTHTHTHKHTYCIHTYIGVHCAPHQSPRKFEPECTTQPVTYPKETGSSGATTCGLMTSASSASANSSNASQQRNPGMSLGVDREKPSPSVAFTSLHVSLSDSTFSVCHECEPPL